MALTGTPGVGKSSVARLLDRRMRTIEIGELARAHGAATGRGRQVTVDLVTLRRRLARPPERAAIDLVVGHLAHLLPVREAIVLRCHPIELLERLARARRGRAADRSANFVSEATDAILLEALARGLPVYEVDTTGRSVETVARVVARRLRQGGPPRYGEVDWLSDRRVTEHLLERTA